MADITSMNEKFRNARVKRTPINPDNPDLRWVVEADWGSNGILSLPFSSSAGARAVADYINANGRVPDSHTDDVAGGVMAFEQAGRRDVYVPANGGLERPTVARNGRRVLYCWNPGLGKHAYIDLGTDTVLEPFELSDYGLS